MDKSGIFPQIDIVASSSPCKGVVIPTSRMIVPRTITARKLYRTDLEVGESNKEVTTIRDERGYIKFVRFTFKQSSPGLFLDFKNSINLLVLRL